MYDKTGLLELAKGLHSAGVGLLGSGGTARKIRDAGIPIQYVNLSSRSISRSGAHKLEKSQI